MSTQYAAKIYLQEALQAFMATLMPVTAFGRNFSPQASAKGDAVIVPRVSALTATTFGNTYENSGGELVATTVNLTNHRIVGVDITDRQALENGSAVVGTYFAQAGKALGKLVVQDILSLVTTTNFGSAFATTSASLWTLTQVRSGRKTLRDRDVDTDVASLVLDNDIFDSLLGSSNISQYLQYGTTSAIMEGRIPRLVGLNLIESNIIPLNSMTLAGFVVHPDAIAVGMRYLAPQRPEEYDMAEAITDAETGLTIGYRQHYSKATGKLHMNLECLFGYAVGLSLGLSPITVP
jgi:hypothetical protein